jgi:hypothetical protein
MLQVRRRASGNCVGFTSCVSAAGTRFFCCLLPSTIIIIIKWARNYRYTHQRSDRVLYRPVFARIAQWTIYYNTRRVCIIYTRLIWGAVGMWNSNLSVFRLRRLWLLKVLRMTESFSNWSKLYYYYTIPWTLGSI